MRLRQQIQALQNTLLRHAMRRHARLLLMPTVSLSSFS